MYLVVGLGNPGEKYEKTRHNIGKKTVSDFRVFASASAWRTDKKFGAQISEGLLGEEKIILAIPTTFMNNSGKAVKLLIIRYRLPVTNLIVIHDDIDLPMGKIKISQKSGSAGHKGVESIIKDLKTKDFARIRIGIQPKSGKPRKTENFVLRNFTKAEENILKKIIEKSIPAIEMAILHGAQGAMNEFNK
jgi:PTH1 family peptidyl-tRNA hydrolase